MANAKQRQEALSTPAAQMFKKGRKVTDIIRVTGTNYTRVHETLVTAGLITDADTDD